MSATAYLDWSTLCDAFKAKNGLADSQGGAYLDLHALVEEIGGTGGLCLSPSHPSELVIWEPYENALAMGGWLDSLKPRWLRPVDAMHDDEVRWWLARELGVADAPAYSPIVGTLLEAYPRSAPPLRPESRAMILADPSLSALVRQAHRHPSVPEFRDNTVDNFTHLHADRTANQFPPDEMARILDRKLRETLALRALALVPTFPDFSQQDVLAAARRVFDRSESIPSFRVMSRLFRQLGEEIAAQDATSERFAARFASMGYDAMHLVGAAYCDLFTCDHRVDRAIGDFRATRGMFPQVSVRGAGGSAAFVAELRRQWRELRRREGLAGAQTSAP